MPMTILEIVDSAVKIGSGAAISGVATYWVTKLSFEKERKREQSIHVRELLEQVASRFEIFSSNAQRYWAMAVEVVRYKEKEKPLPADTLNRFNQTLASLYSSYSDLQSAEGILLLIGAVESHEKVREFGVIMFELSDRDLNRALELSSGDLQEYQGRIAEARLAVYQALKRTYTEKLS